MAASVHALRELHGNASVTEEQAVAEVLQCCR
jgi:hypothetical protein